MSETQSCTINREDSPTPQQHEDAALKTCIHFFADELLPFFGIHEKVKAFGPTELVHLDISKLFQDFNLVMEDGTWKHFEFQSTNEGLEGLKRFRVYESLTSYHHKVPVVTYVLFSGSIKKPMTCFSEGINSYQVIPIILIGHDADKVIANLEAQIKAGEKLTKEDLVPLTLCCLMGGTMSQAERIKAAYRIVNAATEASAADDVNAEDIRKIEAVIYAMADKFLESDELKQIREGIAMTRLGRMLIEQGMSEGIEQTKLENARNLLDLLDDQIIAKRIGLSLEAVQGLRAETATKK